MGEEAVARRDDGLGRRLREAGPEELQALIHTAGDAIDAGAARQALRNPYLTAEVVAALLARPALLAAYELRRDLAACPLTPRTEALRFVAGLYWRDLVGIGLDVRVPPAVRRAAERHLAARLPGLAVGEKVTLARRAGGGALALLRLEPDPRVVAALLDNPRLTEGLLAPLVTAERAAPEVLRTIAEDRRWGARYPIRVALSRNPRTPPATALALLPRLKRPDLEAVAENPRLAPAVRRRAQTLLGRG